MILGLRSVDVETNKEVTRREHLQLLLLELLKCLIKIVDDVLDPLQTY